MGLIILSSIAYVGWAQQRLQIVNKEGDIAYTGHPETTIDKALDGHAGWNWWECYVANMPNNGWAKFYFNQPYMVQRIRLFNREEGAERMTDINVKVCSKSDGQCQLCGVAGYTAPKSWATINCPGGGLKGDYIHLQNPNMYLQFCEIEVYGSPVPAPTTTAPPPTTAAPTAAPVTCPVCPEVCPTECPVATCPTDAPTAPPEEPPVCPEFDEGGEIGMLACGSIKVKDSSRACDNMFDDSLDRNVKGGSCFVSQSNKRGWVEVMLAETTQVGRVVILSKGNGEGLKGAKIEVCMDDEDNCQYFAKVKKVEKDVCTVISAAPKTGNMVRVSIEGSVLVICEMKVYPN